MVGDTSYCALMNLAEKAGHEVGLVFDSQSSTPLELRVTHATGGALITAAFDPCEPGKAARALLDTLASTRSGGG